VYTSDLVAQSSSTAGGIGLSTNSGSVDFSIGQIDYIHTSTPGYNISLGIQQPFVHSQVALVSALKCSGIMLDQKKLPQELAIYQNQGFLPYSGGNGGVLPDTTFKSIEVEGLFLTIKSNMLAIGDGMLPFVISGIPNRSGVAIFTLKIGNKFCEFTLNVSSLEPNIDALSCTSYILIPDRIEVRKPYNGRLLLKYIGGNGKSIVGTSIRTDGVSGIEAFLEPTILNKDSGQLVISLKGIGDQYGVLSIPLQIGDKLCTISINLEQPSLNITNFFSPNGDGINDIWSIPDFNLIYPEGRVYIYERSGRKILELNATNVFWDGIVNGKAASAGVYWYVIDTAISERSITGNITLIR